MQLCRLVLFSGMGDGDFERRVGIIVRVAARIDGIYIDERSGRGVRLPDEEGVILDMDVERKRMTVNAEKFFDLLEEEE